MGKDTQPTYDSLQNALVDEGVIFSPHLEQILQRVSILSSEITSKEAIAVTNTLVQSLATLPERGDTPVTTHIMPLLRSIESLEERSIVHLLATTLYEIIETHQKRNKETDKFVGIKPGVLEPEPLKVITSAKNVDSVGGGTKEKQTTLLPQEYRRYQTLLREKIAPLAQDIEELLQLTSVATDVDMVRVKAEGFSMKLVVLMSTLPKKFDESYIQLRVYDLLHSVKNSISVPIALLGSYFRRYSVASEVSKNMESAIKLTRGSLVEALNELTLGQQTLLRPEHTTLDNNKDLVNALGLIQGVINTVAPKLEEKIDSSVVDTVPSNELRARGELVKLVVDMNSQQLTEDRIPWVDSQMNIVMIVQNLLINALQHTSEGYVKLSVRHREAALYISVEDTGEGIPSENKDRIFELGFTTKQNREVKGTGVGLYLVNEEIKKWKGKIRVESLKKGTRFNVLLPLCLPNVALASSSSNVSN